MSDLAARRMLALIRRIASETYDGNRPADLLIGEIESLDPLCVRAGACRLPLPMLLVPERLGGALHPGDTVALLKAQGGQKYLILDILKGGTGE